MLILWNPIYKAFHQIRCCGIWCGSCVCMTWRGHVCDMTNTCMWRDVYVWCASYMSVACLIHVCDVNHTHLCCESYICVTWFIRLCMTWFIHMCVVVHPCVWHGSYIWVGAVSHVSIGHVDRICVFDSCMISHLVGVPRLTTLSIMYKDINMYMTHIWICTCMCLPWPRGSTSVNRCHKWPCHEQRCHKMIVVITEKWSQVTSLWTS